jgi:Ca2+-binding RTX toxin-like protein
LSAAECKFIRPADKNARPPPPKLANDADSKLRQRAPARLKPGKLASSGENFSTTTGGSSMPFVITGKNSVLDSEDVFSGATGDSLTVNSDGYLFATDGDAVNLGGIWTVKVNGFIGSGADALILNMTGLANKASTIAVGADGDISGVNGILSAQAANISIAKGGAIFGADSAIKFTADAVGNYKITNAGLIQSNGAACITLDGTGTHTVINSGTISGDDAIFSNPTMSNNLIKNSGNILGDIILSGGNDSVTNSKQIAGNVSLGDGNDTVTNSGIINGAVSMGIGNDVLKNTGTIMGTINLGDGDDAFTGGAKDEVLSDQDGEDKYSFGGGNDRFDAMSSFADIDTADGGAGIDIYDASNTASSNTINIDTVTHTGTVGAGVGVGPNVALGADIAADFLKGFENVLGGSGIDVIYGSKSANQIFGLGGKDELWGYGGNDKLDGGMDNDLLIGGAGRDQLSGGSGDDTFYFLTLAESGKTAATRDLIVDFGNGTDKIDLSFLDANTKVAGNQQFTLIAADLGFGAFTKNAGELHFRRAGGNTLVEGDINGDGKTDFQIELAGYHFLDGGDFIL